MRPVSEGGASDRSWLTEEQAERLGHACRKLRGTARADDGEARGGIIRVKRNGLRRRDAPAADGPQDGSQGALRDRLRRRSRPGALARMFVALARPGVEGDTPMIDGARPKAGR
jgi:transposase